ncbi:MAG TPA: hypothetical protein VFI29_14480 [Hanamia sp.]|nr:hypothetical protein [Hanamia sp.]
MPIDTGDLTDETYNAIMIEAERFNHDLTLQFGLLSYECENESDFILKSKKLITEMLRYNNAVIDDMFFGNPPKTKDFHNALRKILDNISKLKNSH